jgi:hypothetical protein
VFEPSTRETGTEREASTVTVECSVESLDNVLVAVLTGRLGLADVARLRLRLVKCLAEQPDALLVDLSGCTVAEPLALAVFTAVSSQAVRWPGIPVLLCAAAGRTQELLSGAAFRHIPQFAGIEAAREHAAAYRQTLPSFTDELLPLSGAARHARNEATDACLRWDLPHLVGPVSLIVSELVSNVIDHANTMATLRLSLRPRYLTVAVRDGSPVEPVWPGTQPGADGRAGLRGRGLLLVQEIAHSCGCLPTQGGKVVWASLLS